MGDRAIFVCRDESGCFSPGVYIHGGGAQAIEYLRQAAPRMRKHDVHSAAARLCGVLHELISDSNYLGLLPPPEGDSEGDIDWESYSHGDAGVVIVNVDDGTAQCVAGYLDGQTATELPFDESSERLTEGVAALDLHADDAELAVSQLMAALHSPDWHVAASAAYELSRIGEDAKDAIPEMTKLLGSEDANVRAYMAVALGEFGPHAKSTVDELIAALDDQENCWFQDKANSYPVRFRVAFAIAKIDQDREEILPVIREALVHKHEYARGEAHECVRRLGRNAKAFIADLKQTENHRDPLRRTQSQVTLAIIDPTYEVQDPIARQALEFWRKMDQSAGGQC